MAKKMHCEEVSDCNGSCSIWETERCSRGHRRHGRIRAGSLAALCCWAFANPTVRGQSSAARNADLFPGSDVGAKIRAAETDLGSGPGVISINTPGVLSNPLTLGTNHGLLLNAPIVWSATMTLTAANDIRCSAKGSIVSTVPVDVPIFFAINGSHIAIHNCSIAMKNNSPVLAGDGLYGLSMHHLAITGGSIAHINPDHGESAGGTATDLTFDHNTVTDAANTGGAALLLVNTIGAVVDSNTFTGISTGTQWWGGDSAKGTLAQVRRTGKITLMGNQCHGVTACLWGSMGYEITVAHNTADGCLDVCFDTEGGVDTSFVENTATNCNSGCGAIFFFSRGISFVRNSFSGDSPGGGLFFIKNSSADPVSHAGLNVSKNTLTCATTCNAVFQEAVSQATFDGNMITNGVYTPAGFGQNVTISHNEFVFSRPLPANSAVIRGPSITGGTTLTIEANSVSSSVAQGADSACIRAVWNDFNNSDTYVIRGNRCEGTLPFPVAVITETAGANPGPHATWMLEGNLGAGKIVHKRTTSNDFYSAK